MTAMLLASIPRSLTSAAMTAAGARAPVSNVSAAIALPSCDVLNTASTALTVVATMVELELSKNSPALMATSSASERTSSS